MYRSAVALLLASTAAATTVYDCQFFDCVTPFVRNRPPLPPPGSIPLPANYGPCGPGHPIPVCGTLTGLTALWIAENGVAAGLFDGGGDRILFLYDGTATYARPIWPDLFVVDIATDGTMLALESGQFYILSPSGMQNHSAPLRTRFWSPPFVSPNPNDPYGYSLEANSTVGAKYSASGGALVIPAIRQRRLPIVPGGPLGFCGGGEPCLFDAYTFVLVGGPAPQAIPEPTAAGLLGAGLGTLRWLLARRRNR